MPVKFQPKPLILIAAIAIAALFAWSSRPDEAARTGSPALTTSARLYSITLANQPKPNHTAEAITAAGFVLIPDAHFNDLIPPAHQQPEFASLPAYRRAGATTTETRLVGYRPGEAHLRLYAKTAGSQQQVQAFQRETDALVVQFGR